MFFMVFVFCFIFLFFPRVFIFFLFVKGCSVFFGFQGCSPRGLGWIGYGGFGSAVLTGR